MAMSADIVEKVERYMARPYRIEMRRSDWGWYVKVPDLPGCMSQGETPDEAFEMIQEAQRSWLQVALEDGRPIPAPQDEDSDEAGGRLIVRLPKTIHRQLAQAADTEGVSLNLFAATALARAVGREEVKMRQRGRPRKSAEV